MRTAYYVYAEVTAGNFPIAIFWDRGAAETLAKVENDHAQAEIVQIHDIPLVDRYGFPCRIQDLAVVAPWATE